MFIISGGSAQPEWLGATAGLEVIVLALVFFALVAGSCAMCCMVYDAVLYVIAAILALFAGRLRNNIVMELIQT
jgi:hypothetical protein